MAASTPSTAELVATAVDDISFAVFDTPHDPDAIMDGINAARDAASLLMAEPGAQIDAPLVARLLNTIHSLLNRQGTPAVTVVVRGGVVQDVMCHRLDLAGKYARVIDYDGEGCTVTLDGEEAGAAVQNMRLDPAPQPIVRYLPAKE